MRRVRRTNLTSRDEFVEALLAITGAGTDFLVVGVSGINFYATDASEAVLTHDLDVWLKPEVSNLRSALVALRDAGFEFRGGDEPFVDLEDEVVLRNVIRSGGTLVAKFPPDVERMDLMLSLFDFSFDEERRRSRAFRFEDQTIRVADIETLLRSKERAGRPKDIEFLRMHGARFRDLAKSAKRSRSKTSKSKK